MLLSTLVCASYGCVEFGSNAVDSYTLPSKSGTYYAAEDDITYSDGTDIEVGKYFWYSKWEDDPWYKYHFISCKVADIKIKYGGCYTIKLDCTVQELTQFYNANYTASITYTELKGHRSDGTLKWSRDSIGSTDIYCYDKSGMTAVKHVNNPYYCR